MWYIQAVLVQGLPEGYWNWQGLQLPEGLTGARTFRFLDVDSQHWLALSKRAQVLSIWAFPDDFVWLPPE